MKALLILLPAAFACAAHHAHAHSQEMRPGRYGMTAELAGGPQSRDESCVTPADIDQSMARFGGDADECKVSGLKRGGGRVSYRVSCVEHTHKVEKSVEGRMTPEAFDFTITTDVKAGPKPPSLRIRGTRLGDCR